MATAANIQWHRQGGGFYSSPSGILRLHYRGGIDSLLAQCREKRSRFYHPALQTQLVRQSLVSYRSSVIGRQVYGGYE